MASSSPPSQSVAGGVSGGFLRVVSPAELDQRDAERTRQAAARSRPDAPPDIGSWIRQQWYVFRNHRNLGNNPLNWRLLRAQRMFEAKYDPEKLAQIQAFGGSEVYSRLVANKARGATSLLRDVYLGPERPWEIKSQPDPPVPAEVRANIMQLIQTEVATLQAAGQLPQQDQIHMRYVSLLYAAQQAARRNADAQAEQAAERIDDILVQGNFYQALAEFLLDLPLFPYAVLKGPVVRLVPRLTWTNHRPMIRNKPVMFWERVNPFNVYWDPGASTIEEATIIERKRYTRSDLNDLLGLPGYSEQAVRGALVDYANGIREWLDAPDAEQAINEGREDPNLNRSKYIEGIEYHGPMQGRLLLDQGVSRELVTDLDRDYLVQSWVVGRHTLKTVINPSPRQRHPYFLTSFEKIPGTVHGHGLPDILEDTQEVSNAAYRSLVNNLCLTGDTVVYRHPRNPPAEKRGRRSVRASMQPRAQAEVTLLELWDGYQKYNRGLRRNVIRALDVESGKIIGQRIAEIHDNGVQDVFEITTARGYRVKATAPHRFLADDGSWRHVRDFRVGDLVGVNGAVVPLPRVCRDCGAPISRSTATRCRVCAGKAQSASVLGSWNWRQATLALQNRGVRRETAHGRKFVQAQKKDHCEECGIVGVPLELHHLDRDPWNCAPANLRTFCAPCHKIWHERHDHFGDPYGHKYLDFDRIESIRHVGRERTFCLTMQGHPNFIANGFCSHNSISSGPQVVINDEMIAPTEHSDELYPWKRWHVTGDPLGNQREPITFFQPNSNVQELLLVISSMNTQADETSGIPRYMTGESLSGGAGRTASGLGMLMNNAEKVAQMVAANIDRDVLEPLLQHLYDMVMMTDTTGLLTGEEEVRVSGSEAKIEKSQAQQKRLQFLQITANPIDAQIIGELGRARILRALAKDLDMPDDIVPDDQTLQAQLQAQRQMQQVGQALVAHAQGQGAAPGNMPQPGPGTQGAPGTPRPRGPASAAGGGQPGPMGPPGAPGPAAQAQGAQAPMPGPGAGAPSFNALQPMRGAV